MRRAFLAILTAAAISGCKSAPQYVGVSTPSRSIAPPTQAEIADDWTMIASTFPQSIVEINGEYVGLTPLMIHSRAWGIFSEGMLVTVKSYNPETRKGDSKTFISSQRRPRKIIFDTGDPQSSLNLILPPPIARVTLDGANKITTN